MNSRKALRLGLRPMFMRALLRHRVAAAVEHLEAIGYSRANTLIDIGANKGQFSLAFRAARPAARIIAFEPLPDAAARYEQVMAPSGGTVLHRVALSDHGGEAEFFVTDRADSSSLLRPGANQLDAFGVSTVRTITVPVRRLDECVDLAALAHPLLVKIDVQGAELQVLGGCDALEAADYLYVELSFVELYTGQPLHGEVASYLAERGFDLAGVYNQASTGRFGPTQADFLFRRAPPARATR